MKFSINCSDLFVMVHDWSLAKSVALVVNDISNLSRERYCNVGRYEGARFNSILFFTVLV